MRSMHGLLPFGTTVIVLMVGLAAATAEERTERFDKDPKWEGQNNRRAEPRSVVQDFGYSATGHAGGKRGELGGFLTPAAEPAYYAKHITPMTLDDSLTASGAFTCSGKPFHALVGFFNAGTLNEWRTPNTIALRLSGRGNVFYAWLEYCTSRWRAGGDDPRGFTTVRDEAGRVELKGFPAGAVHQWSLKYDPKGNGGAGVITATIGTETAECNISPDHRSDGATFDHFGVMNVMKSADTGGDLWFDDVSVNGELESFDKDPEWDGFQNRRTYESTNIRPLFDFGYSATKHAGGKMKGEIGGSIFRGDCRYPKKMAYYADRLADLTLAKPLRVSGRVTLRRGVTDSTVLFGFFHSKDSMVVNPSQQNGVPRNFLGVMIEGPSREGFYFCPTYRMNGDESGSAIANDPPRIYPDGKPHDWSLKYEPTAGGQITVTLDDKSVRMTLPRGDLAVGAHFNRMGFVTTWIDGNGQEVYMDDLTYTSNQSR
jgi:hypothetical protein